MLRSRAMVFETQPFTSAAKSVSSGTTTKREPRGRYPLYGSTGQISRTDRNEFTGPSILVARVGANAGSVYVVDGSYGVTDNTLVVRLSPGHNQSFFAQYLEHAELNRMVYGSGQPLVTGSMLKSLDVPAVVPAEQARVAGALDDVDRLITTLERLLAKKQAIKQGMMQELLSGHVRLPGYSAPWTEARLGSLGRCMRGVTYEPDADLSAGDRSFTVRLLRSNNVQDGRIDRHGLQFVHDRRVSSAQVLVPGDVVICMANGSRALVGKAALFEPKKGEPRYTFGAFMGAFRTDKSVASPRFIAELMRTHMFRNWLDVLLSGSSINNLRPGDIEGFVTTLPGPTEQVAIAETLGDADREIDHLRRRLSKTRAIKQGMMQQLLTGRVRLLMESAA